MRHPTPPPPSQTGVRDGLAYNLWLPDREPRGGVVIIHGAGSSKESHHDYARAAHSVGLAAVVYDQRGHGESEGALDGRLLSDVATIAGLLPPAPLALRGSSMGATLAIAAARPVGAAAVVAICPATPELLLRGLDAGAFDFDADRPALQAALQRLDLAALVRGLGMPLLLMHAEGDEQVPVANSRALAAEAQVDGSRLVVAPGGHHRSVQHDGELQGLSLRFITMAFSDLVP